MQIPHFSWVPILFGDTVNILYWKLKILFSPEEAYSVFLVEIFLFGNANTEPANKYSQRMKVLILYRGELLILGLREGDASKYLQERLFFC